MSGFSLTVLRLSSDSILGYVDAETRTCGWSGNSFVRKIGPVVTVPDPLTMEKYIRQKKIGPESEAELRALVIRAANFVCEALIDSENELNMLDTGSGDADCGSTLGRGAKRLKQVLKESGQELATNPTLLFRTIGTVSEKEMGGSSGAMFSIFWEASASKLEGAKEVSADSITGALEAGLDAVKRHGRARLGDRTLIDSLQPALEVLRVGITEAGSSASVLASAAEAAEIGAAATATMKASAGRASYVNASELKFPDPGAKAIAIIFGAVLKATKTPEN
jgi:dihydroxyacetone kinase